MSSALGPSLSSEQIYRRKAFSVSADKAHMPFHTQPTILSLPCNVCLLLPTCYTIKDLLHFQFHWPFLQEGFLVRPMLSALSQAASMVNPEDPEAAPLLEPEESALCDAETGA